MVNFTSSLTVVFAMLNEYLDNLTEKLIQFITPRNWFNSARAKQRGRKPRNLSIEGPAWRGIPLILGISTIGVLNNGAFGGNIIRVTLA